MTNYDDIIQAIAVFGGAHYQVKKVGSDFREQMPNYCTKDEKYPVLFCVPTGSQSGQIVRNIGIDIYCVDLIQDDRGNITQVVRDTELILSDLFTWFSSSQFEKLNIEEIGKQPINNADLDYVAGYFSSFNFVVPAFCENVIPMAGITPPPSVVCEPVTVNINGVEVAQVASGSTENINVTLNGVNSGTWNGVDTWEVVADIAPQLPSGRYIPTNDGSGGLLWQDVMPFCNSGTGFIQKFANSGVWESGGVARIIHNGNLELNFRFDTSSGANAMLGLSYYRTNMNYIPMPHSLFNGGGSLLVIEDDIVKTAVGTIDTDLLTIARVGLSIEYRLNGSTFYNSAIINNGPVQIDSLFNGIVTVQDIEVII